jgi:hypothetical protein
MERKAGPRPVRARGRALATLDAERIGFGHRQQGDRIDDQEIGPPRLAASPRERQREGESSRPHPGILKASIFL